MPYREKIAWISLVTMLVVFGGFYAGVVSGQIESEGFVSLIGLMLAVLAAFLLQAGLTFAAALASRDDPTSPQDERERLIELKAARIAFYVLIAAILAGTFVALHAPELGLRPFSRPQIGLTMVAAIVLADLVKSAAQIVYFRRGV
jgi:drug/metabolite transporter (DMT)-like permease